MAQHDYVIDNSTGATVRADINSVLQAIASNNSGSSAPSTTYAFQLFADTTNNVLKIRNAANNGYIHLFTLAGGVDVDAASNFNEDVTFTGASANIVFDKSDNALEFADNAKGIFGTGADMSLFHNGTNSIISNVTGAFKLLLNSDDNAIIANQDGAIELYFDNAKKAETVTGGFTVTGTCTATAFSGDGSALTGVGGTTINNNADNRLITGSGSANTLEGEANLTFSSNTLTVHEASLKGNQLLFGPSGTAFIDHSTTGQDIQFRTSVSSSQDTTGPTIKSNGNIAFASGKGIDFSAASGSNAGASSSILEDYEEGTFTPDWKCGGGGPTSITYGTTNGANYVKVGNVVTVSGRTDITASSGGTGFWFITNMPFTVKSGTKEFNCVGSISLENFAVPDNVIDTYSTIEQNSNNMHLTGTRKDNTPTPSISINTDSVFTCQFSITYRTA